MTTHALRNRSRDALFLCYHSVHPDGPPFLSVPPETFERQLWLLRRRGYRPATGIEDQRRPERARVFLTFDDGYRDNFEYALPLLHAHAMTALVFILPPLVDCGGALRWEEVRARVARYPGVMRSLTWEMADQMAEHGIEFGSHGLRHSHFTDLGDDELTQELLDSRRRIAARLGRCRSLAYPFGEWSPRVARAAAAAGYTAAFALPYGSPRAGPDMGASRLSIPRLAVDHRDDERRFAMKITPLGRRLLLSGAKAIARRAQDVYIPASWSSRLTSTPSTSSVEPWPSGPSCSPRSASSTTTSRRRGWRRWSSRSPRSS